MKGDRVATVDVVVVGGGPAGLACARAARTAGLEVRLVEAGALGGQLVNVPEVQQAPGFEGGAGWDVAALLVEQAQDGGVVIEIGEVLDAGYVAGTWRLTGRDVDLASLTVVLATGTHATPLDVKGAAALAGRGVSDCAACDGPLFAGQPVAVVGDGDTALWEARHLADIASEVLLLLPGRRPVAVSADADALHAKPNLHAIPSARLVEVVGDSSVTGVRYADDGDEEHELAVRAVFAALPRTPAVSPAIPGLTLDAHGAVHADAAMRAGPPGAFVAGDVRAGSPRCLAAAIADGGTAAVSAIRHLGAA